MEKKTIIWHQDDINDMPEPQKDILVWDGADYDLVYINKEDWEAGRWGHIEKWAYLSDVIATSKALDVAINAIDKAISAYEGYPCEDAGDLMYDDLVFARTTINEIIGGK